MAFTLVPKTIVAATTAHTVLSEDAGVIHYVEDLTGNCTFTLPTPKAGLWFEFRYAGVAADAQNWIITTGSNTNFFIGGLQFIDNDTDVVAPIAGNGTTNSKLTVITPDVGTIVRVESLNGTTWCLSGFVGSATIPTFGDQ